MDPDYEDQDPRDDQTLDSSEEDIEEDVDAGDAPTDEDEPTEADDEDIASIRKQIADLAKERDQYKARWQGMSPRMQQEVEARRRAEERAEQLEQQYMAAQIQSLPEEERPAAIQNYQQQMAYQQLLRQDQQRQQTADQLAKLQVIETFAQQYKVPKEKLARFNDPYSMQAFAEEYAAMRRTTRKEERKVKQKDRFEGGGGNTPPRRQKPPETMAEARERLAKNYTWRME